LPTSVFSEFRSSLNVRGAPSSDCGGVLECNLACGPVYRDSPPSLYMYTDYA
jgi:hypothetical protein